MVTRPSWDERVSILRSSPSDPLEEVGVGICGEDDRGVAKDLRHQRDVGAGGQEQGGAAVSEVVEANVAKPRGLHQLPEAFSEPLAMDGVTVGLSEHEIVISIGGRPLTLRFVLGEPVSEQRSDRDSTEIDTPGVAAGGLGRAEREPFVPVATEITVKHLGVELHDLLAYDEVSVSHVQVRPAKTNGLTSSQSRHGHQLKDRREWI